MTIKVEDYPRLDIETDDTGRIQRAIDYAKSLKLGENVVGNSLYYETKIQVVFGPKIYITSAPITIYKGVDLVSEGQTILKSNPPDKTIKCFVGNNRAANRMAIKNITFVGYATAIEVSGDVDVSMFLLEDVAFHACGIGLDTVSFVGSRSKIVHLLRCISWKTNVFVKNFCDKMTLDNCWVTHSGWGGAAIYNDGNLRIESGVFVPTNGMDARWIDNYENNVGQQGLFVEGVRFGGEGGGLPIVYNYAGYDYNLAKNQGNIIAFENCQMASAGGVVDSCIKLFNMPNRISMTNSYGFFDLLNGIISIDSSYDPSTIPSNHYAYISIEVDHTIYQASAYTQFDSRLDKFMTFNKPLKSPSPATFEHNKILTPVGAKVDAGQTVTVYKLGLNASYPVGIASITFTVGKRGSSEADRKRVDFIIKNSTTTTNRTTNCYNAKETSLYQYGASPLDYIVSLAVAEGFGEVRLTAGAYNIDASVTGEVNLAYVYATGQSVFEN